MQFRDWTDYWDASREFERWLLVDRPAERGRVALHVWALSSARVVASHWLDKPRDVS